LRLGPPGEEAATLVPALVDTGADCTLVPLDVAQALELPVVDETEIEGIASEARQATVHVARVEFAGVECLARVVAFGHETILGRDLLNRTVARLDGPARSLSFESPQRRRLR
jgi:clan AA aspartic protease